MELRHRVRAATLHFGRKGAEDPAAVEFWLCEGLKKKFVTGRKDDALAAALPSWDLPASSASAAEQDALSFMNESSGIVVPRDEPMGTYIADRDVVRICTQAELEPLLERFARRDQTIDAELIAPSTKSNTSIGAALSKLKKMSASNATIKRIQKTFDDRPSPQAEEADLLERFPEIDPILESDEVEELPAGTAATCDLCDVSWPEEPTTPMCRLKELNLVLHQGCAQFAADILAYDPNIKSREEFMARASNIAEVNCPGTFHITVHRAMELPSVQLLGSPAPYVKMSLLPWKEPRQTKPSENGGRHPLWKSMHGNVLQFTHMYNSSITPIPLLEVEIWNANYLADDQIACGLLDMTPLLRYPNIEAKRWFTLSSRLQAPLAIVTNNSNAVVANQPRLLLSIKFVPLEGKYTGGNEHKFRVHQLKSVGLAIPNCAVCDRVIMNVIKKSWGYRCELCGIDVHKGCIMKAISKCACNRLDPPSDAEEELAKAPQLVERNGVSYKVIRDEGSRLLLGQLFVNFQGLHLCTKQCQQEKNLHSKNIFEGDTYCRLTVGDIVHETNPVLKSADPMYMENVCFHIRSHNFPFRIEVIDFNSDTVIAELSITLFELLQREADQFIRTNEMLQKLKIPLRRLTLDEDQGSGQQTGETHVQENEDHPVVTDADRHALLPPASTSKSSRKKIGFALIDLKFIETKEDLLRKRVNGQATLLEREEKECNVETLRITVDRLGRVIKLVQWVDVEYSDIISWKNKRKSTVCLLVFVYCCVFMNLEYAGAYVLYGILVYMLIQLRSRLEGSFVSRWIGYMDYDLEQEDRLKLFRPLADLQVAVHEARLSEATYRLLMASQTTMLKDSGSSKMSLFVRIKYLPNDRKRSELGGENAFVPSEFEEAIVAWTPTVEKNARPVWRRSMLNSSSQVPKQRKEFPLRNFNISWRHDETNCDCDRCVACQKQRSSSPEAIPKTACGVDHHAYYFPVPQAVRKSFTGRDDLVSWRAFPGLLSFELCVSLTGEAKESPDMIIAGGTIALRDIATKDENSSLDLVLPLSTLPSGSVPITRLPLSESSDKIEDSDNLLVRVLFRLPATVNSLPKEPSAKITDANGSVPTPTRTPSRRTSKKISRAERNISEFVCESLIVKEKRGAIGGHLFDALWKVKETMKNIQNDIGRACGTIACVENLFNWTHPWKTGAVFAGVFVGALVCSFIPGRWLILMFGLFEFGASLLLGDLPPSNRVRHIIWNLLSSVPTDQDLIDIYAAEREIYMENQLVFKEREEQEEMRLRHHALWTGMLETKVDGDRSFKPYFVAYRAFRFIFWKTAEDAEIGASPSFHMMFENASTVVDKTDDKTWSFQVVGVNSNGSEEKRLFSLATEKMKDALLDIVHQSCESGPGGSEF